jgi:hypothetical protein
MIPAKKSLGQNFLKSKEALRALVEAGGVTSEDVILEVGPGKGVLTEELVKLAKKVIAVEKDDRLIELLNEKFKNEIAEGKLEILHQDILEFDPTSLTTPPRGLGTPPNLGGDKEEVRTARSDGPSILGARMGGSFGLPKEDINIAPNQSKQAPAPANLPTQAPKKDPYREPLE